MSLIGCLCGSVLPLMLSTAIIVFKVEVLAVRELIICICIKSREFLASGFLYVLRRVVSVVKRIVSILCHWRQTCVAVVTRGTAMYNTDAIAARIPTIRRNEHSNNVLARTCNSKRCYIRVTGPVTIDAIAPISIVDHLHLQKNKRKLVRTSPTLGAMHKQRIHLRAGG